MTGAVFNSIKDFTTSLSREQRKLNESDFVNAARRLGLNRTAAIKAVAVVESGGAGFNAAGITKALFEPHKFNLFTNSRHLNTKFVDDPSKVIACKSWDKNNYPSSLDGVYSMFFQAYKLNPQAALRATSWGSFQILGDNFAACGYSCVEDFVLAMTISEAKSLEAFVSFVISNRIDDELRASPPDFDGFAYVYNGPGYKKNDYAGKMRKAYAKFYAAETKPLPPSTAFTAKVLQPKVAFGSKSDFVLKLQKLVNSAVVSPKLNLLEDGVYGPRTHLGLEVFVATYGETFARTALKNNGISMFL